MLIDANEFVIRKLILQKKTPQAILKLKAFAKKHEDAPERYEQLVAAIIRQLGTKIKELRSFLQRKPNDAEARKELNRYRTDFYTFAQTLYDRDKALALEQRTDVTKLYASALLEKGAAERATKNETQAKTHFDEALKLFRDCETLDKKGRQDDLEEIEAVLQWRLQPIRVLGLLGDRAVELRKKKEAQDDKSAGRAKEHEGTARKYLADAKKRFAQWETKLDVDQSKLTDEQRKKLPRQDRAILAAIEPVHHLFREKLKAVLVSESMKVAAEQMMEMAAKAEEAYLRLLKALFGIVPTQDPKKPDLVEGPVEIRGAYLFANAGRNNAEVVERMATVARKLIKAHEHMAVMQKQSLPIDSEVVLGLARSFTFLGQFKEAIEYYDRILQGLDKTKHPQLYWETELEYCRCAVIGLADDKKAMNALIRRIDRLVEKPDYRECGLDREFATVKAQAEEALKALKK